MVSGISSYILARTCPGLDVICSKNPAQGQAEVSSVWIFFCDNLITGIFSHNNTLTWLPECANSWVTRSILLRSMRSAVILTSPVSSGYFHSSICLIKVWRSVRLQISFAYFSFFVTFLWLKKGILLSTFSSKRWLLDTLLSLTFS